MELGLTTGLDAPGAGSELLLAQERPRIDGALAGATAVLDFRMQPTETLVSARLLRDGVLYLDALTDGVSLVWDAELAGAVMVLEVTSVIDGGGQRTRQSTPVVVHHPAPTLLFPLEEEIFEAAADIAVLDMSSAFSGADLTFSLSGARGTIEAATGLLSLDLSQPVEAAQLTIRAENTGGFVEAQLLVTIEPVDGDVVIYDESFGPDGNRAMDFTLDQGAIVHRWGDANSAHVNDPVDGVMRMGFPNGMSWQDGTLTIPVLAGYEHRLEMIVSKYGGSRVPTLSITLVAQDASSIWTSGNIWSSGVSGDMVIDQLVPMHPLADRIEIKAVIPQTGTGDRFQWHSVRVTQHALPQGAPVRDTTVGDTWMIRAQAYTGVTRSLGDFGDQFLGNITGYDLSRTDLGTQVTGSEITITPQASAEGQYGVSARTFNGAERSTAPQSGIPLRVDPLPAAPSLQGWPRLAPSEQWLEPGQQMIPYSPLNDILAGARPLQVEPLALPSWARWDSKSQLVTGAPDQLGADQIMTFEISDPAGRTLTRDHTVHCVAQRSRAATHTVTASGNQAGLLGPGRVIEIADGVSCSFSATGVSIPMDNPCIIRSAPGGTGRIKLINFDNVRGVIVEDCMVDKTDGSAECIFLRNCRGVYLRNLDIRSWRNNGIIGGELDFVTGVTDFRYENNGLYIRGASFVAVQDCRLSEVSSGMILYQASGGIGVFNTSVDRFADDGWYLVGTSDVALHGMRVQWHEGNRVAGQHGDVAQISDTHGPCKRLWIKDFFGSVRGNLGAEQGMFGRGEEFENTNRTLEDMNSDVHFDQCFSVCGHNSHALSLEDFGNTTLSRCGFGAHPDDPDNSFGYSTIKNNIHNCVADHLFCEQFNYTGSTADFTKHWQQINTFRRDGSGYGYADIFPNWATSTLAYEDPRHAVAEGQPPSAARFWVDPDSAWAQAYPNHLPTWLRTG